MVRHLIRYRAWREWLRENWYKVIAVMFAWRLHVHRNEIMYQRQRLTVNCAGERINIGWLPRKGICSNCGVKGGQTRTVIMDSFLIFPWLGIREFCLKCFTPVAVAYQERHDRFMASLKGRSCTICRSPYTYVRGGEDWPKLIPAWSKCDIPGFEGWICGRCDDRIKFKPKALREADNEWYKIQVKKLVRLTSAAG